MGPAAPDGVVVNVRLAREFTPLEARVLHDVVERASPGTLVDVDFRAVRECHDVALLLLARDILQGRVHFSFQGMSLHQARLLGYLGARLESDLAPAPA